MIAIKEINSDNVSYKFISEEIMSNTKTDLLLINSQYNDSIISANKKKTIKPRFLLSGFAMFSMFFGAGNLVFPLKVGQYAQDGFILAILGLLLTAIGIPFSGVIGIILHEGDYTSFFGSTGKYLGFLISMLVIGIMGPFGGIPRCIALSFSTAQIYFSSTKFPLFALFYTLVILAFCIKKTRIINLIGYFLTPILITSIGIIIVRGFIFGFNNASISFGSFSTFIYGLREGYNTMDLFCGFFFSSIIYFKLKEDLHGSKESRCILHAALKSSLIGSVLLSIVYIGFGLVAYMYSSQLTGNNYDQFLGKIGFITLGSYSGLVIGLAIVMSCLTTAIALSAVAAEFIHAKIFCKKFSYLFSLTLLLLTVNVF